MTTFKTSLRIVAAHWRYVLIYLGLVSALGLFTGVSQTNGHYYTPAEARTTVAVIDRDGSDLSRGLASYLGRVGQTVALEDSRRAIQDATASNRIEYILIVPEDYGAAFTAAARSGAEPPGLETVISYSSASGAIADTRTNTYLGQVRDYLASTASDPARAVALADQAMEHGADTRIAASEATPLPTGFLTFIQFSTYTIVAFAVVAIAMLMGALRRRPVRSRLGASPVSSRSRNLGLLGACTIIGLAGWTWIMLLGTTVFPPDDPGAAIPRLAVAAAAMLAYTMVAVAIGFLLGQTGIGEAGANGMANLGGMVMSFLAGAWVPKSMMPDAIVTLSRLTPGYWATAAVNGAATSDSTSWESLRPLVADCGVCALFAVAIACVAALVGRTRARASV